MSDEMDKVQALQEEIDALKKELAAMKAEKEAHAPVAPTASLEVIQSIENSSADADFKVETYCRWAAARAGAIVIAPLVGTIALMANEVYLVSRIAKVYNVKLSERAVIAFLGAMGSRMAGNLLTTLIPFSAVQVPVAVGITYSLGRVTQRWMKDGMPTDMGPYIEMMAQWKDKAREQVDRLRDNPLKNVPLGDETVDFMKRWGSAAKEAAIDAFDDVKEKGQVVVDSVRRRSVVDDVEEAKENSADAKEPVQEDAAPEGETAAADTAEQSVDEKVQAAVEDAKIPLDEK